MTEASGRGPRSMQEQLRKAWAAVVDDVAKGKAPIEDAVEVINGCADFEKLMAVHTRIITTRFDLASQEKLLTAVDQRGDLLFRASYEAGLNVPSDMSSEYTSFHWLRDLRDFADDGFPFYDEELRGRILEVLDRTVNQHII